MATDFEKYIRQGEPGRRERAYTWQTAIGLQAVDGLRTSDYLKETAGRHIEGDISIDEAGSLIKSYYESRAGREPDSAGMQEADKVSVNITRVLSSQTLDFSTDGFISIHRRIFDGVYRHAGRLRDHNISKKEWVLDGDSVSYLNWEDLRRALDYDLERERHFSYRGLSAEETAAHLARFVAGLWQIHPFCEGNTRTTAVFLIQYLRSIGFNADNGLFAEYSWYFRNALVRANYKNATKGIDYTFTYLERFLRNLLYGERSELRNRYMHINPPEEWRSDGDTCLEETGQAQDKYNTSKIGTRITPEVMQLIRAVGGETLSVRGIMERLQLKSRGNFLKLYLHPALTGTYIEALYPDRPHHPRQKYHLTMKGRTLLSEPR